MQTHLSLAAPLSQTGQFTYQAEQKIQCLSMMLFLSLLDENQPIQYVKWITTVGGAHCHSECSRRGWDLDIEAERYKAVQEESDRPSLLARVSCDTLCPACWGAASDVRISTRKTVPAGSTLESRQSVTGVSVTQTLKRAYRCWAVCLQTYWEHLVRIHSHHTSCSFIQS